jgi:hypothetical protein
MALLGKMHLSYTHTSTPDVRIQSSTTYSPPHPGLLLNPENGPEKLYVGNRVDTVVTLLQRNEGL